MKSLEVETHDAMHATYQILLHNSLWNQRSTSSNHSASTKPTPSPHHQQRKNIMRISKYNLSNRRNVRAPNNSPKKSLDIGCVSPRPCEFKKHSKSSLRDDDRFIKANE